MGAKMARRLSENEKIEIIPKFPHAKAQRKKEEEFTTEDTEFHGENGNRHYAPQKFATDTLRYLYCQILYFLDK